jgi:predicted glycosyltransferase
LRDRVWRVLVGVGIDESMFARLGRVAAETGEGRVVVERARSDFTQLLANCELSISQAGYNTLLETVQAGARGIVVPFAGGTETEQAERAEFFAGRGLVDVVKDSELSPESLADAVDRAARKPRPAPGRIDLDGARKSAQLLAGWARERS